jgi:hypothetical protein
LLVDAGRACAVLHDEMVRGVRSRRVQVDEIWSFTYAKKKNLTSKIAETIEGAGDTWTWTAIDADGDLVADRWTELGRVAFLCGLGIIAGVVVSLWATRLVAALLFNTPARDPLMIGAAAVALALVAGGAGWLPARRASRIDPAEALRDA